jgi:hypothetical protein
MSHRSELRATRSVIFGLCLGILVGGDTLRPRPSEASTGERRAAPTSQARSDSIEARIWLDRDPETRVQPGDEIRIYYRVSEDAFVAIFRIDTEGRVSLLFPQHPEADARARGGREYRLLLPHTSRWEVTDAPGEGAFFMIASTEPLDFSLLDFDPEAGWDLSGAGAAAYDDPYQAIDDYVVAVLPAWETVPYALDLLPYEVAEADAAYGAGSGGGPVVIGAPSWGVVIRAPVARPRVRIQRWYGPVPRYGPVARYAPPRYVPPRHAPPRYAPPRHAPPRSVRPPRRPPPRGGPCCRTPVRRPPHAAPGRGRYKANPRGPHR